MKEADDRTTVRVQAIEDRRARDNGFAGVDRRGSGSPRRAAPRQKTLKGAEIVLPLGLPVRCIVRNISATGAKLEVLGPILSTTFDIVFDDDKWPRRSCRIVWRKDTAIGVKFEISEPRSHPAAYVPGRARTGAAAQD